MDCGEYQKDNRWLGNRIVVTIRKITKDYDGDDGRNDGLWGILERY